VLRSGKAEQVAGWLAACILHSQNAAGGRAGVISSSKRQPALTVEALPLAQHVCDVSRHDGVNLRNVGVQLGQVALRAGVQVQLLGLLDEGVCREG
jgi:hypothetical protein